MSEPLSDADKVVDSVFPLRGSLQIHTYFQHQIRNKRLAKLGSQQPSQAPSNAPESATSNATTLPSASTPSAAPSSTESRLATSKTATSPSGPATAQNPFAQLGVKQPPQDGSRIKITPAGSSNVSNPQLSRPSSAAPTASKSTSKPAGATESLEVWESRVLGSIFRLTLDPASSQDSNGNKLQHVAGVGKDLEDEGQPVRLSITIIDQALLEAASNLPKGTPLDYLLGCWKRISKQLRGMRGAKVDATRQDVIKEARRLCMSYCIFAVTIPDMFGYVMFTNAFRSSER